MSAMIHLHSQACTRGGGSCDICNTRINSECLMLKEIFCFVFQKVSLFLDTNLPRKQKKTRGKRKLFPEVPDMTWNICFVIQPHKKEANKPTPFSVTREIDLLEVNSFLTRWIGAFLTSTTQRLKSSGWVYARVFALKGVFPRARSSHLCCFHS